MAGGSKPVTRGADRAGRGQVAVETRGGGREGRKSEEKRAKGTTSGIESSSPSGATGKKQSMWRCRTEAPLNQARCRIHPSSLVNTHPYPSANSLGVGHASTVSALSDVERCQAGLSVCSPSQCRRQFSVGPESEICRDAKEPSRGVDGPNFTTRRVVRRGGKGCEWQPDPFHLAQSARSPRRRERRAEITPVLLPDRHQESSEHCGCADNELHRLDRSLRLLQNVGERACRASPIIPSLALRTTSCTHLPRNLERQVTQRYARLDFQG